MSRPLRSRATVLASMPNTVARIVERTDLNHSTVDKWARGLVRDGEAHISSWEPSGTNGWSAIFSPGRGANAAKPAARKGYSAEPVASTNHCGQRDSLVAAFYGEARP